MDDDLRLAQLLGVTALAAVDRLRPPVEDEAGHGGSAAAALVHLHAWPGESLESLRSVLGISQPATVRTVNRLVADGLLERRPGPDRRTAALILTGAGRAAAERVLAVRAAALRRLPRTARRRRARPAAAAAGAAGGLAGARSQQRSARLQALRSRRLLRHGSLSARPHGVDVSGRPSALAVASAGIGVVGTAYGMARYGYGLLLPDIRRDYGLSTAALGAIAAGCLRHLPDRQRRRRGARHARRAARPRADRRRVRRRGMVLAGLSSGPALLVAGMLVAGVSAAFALPPFSDAVAACLAPERRGRTLASISSGTGWGVALAAPIAIAAGSSWRSAWLAFAAVGVLATAWALHVLPAGASVRAGAALPRLRLGWFVCPRSGPLLAGALLVGLGASLYWTFAVDFLVTGGALEPSSARLFLVLVGVASVAGSGAGDLVERLGARLAFAALSWALALSLALLALAPGMPALAIVVRPAVRRRVQPARRDPVPLERARVRGPPGHRRRRRDVRHGRRAADRAARRRAAQRGGGNAADVRRRGGCCSR